ncbi:MAG: 4-alpha-glucanotransferase [Draconibacterium sp.]|nr:MAG: 4-alpha-glucanotransferase [Draconibacterium sp.]
MKVLMFGWEFPPHISGGLGTACYGLTKGLTELNNIDVKFVVPKAYGDEHPTSMELIGANTVAIAEKELQFGDVKKKIEYLEVESGIVPYVSEKEFWNLKGQKYSKGVKFIGTTDKFTIDFSGEYGSGLLDEIMKYAIVAKIIARDNHFDIIHAHDWLAYPAGIAAASISGKPLVVHVHATEFDRSGGNLNPRVYAVEREGLEKADRIIAVSELTKNTVVKKYGISPEKVTVVYNAVAPLSTETPNFPGKGVNEKIITFLGRITTQKGPEYFIEAASLILRKMNGVRFVMAGSGDLMHDMMERVAELGISDHFYFAGFLKGNDVQQMFKLTDVFVMPSISEPFGIVPLEAMQSGVPVIISKQSGVAEVIENTIKVDFWDTFAMADAIYALLNYPSLSEHFIKKGKVEVDELKWVNSAKKVAGLYKQLLKNF